MYRFSYALALAAAMTMFAASAGADRFGLILEQSSLEQSPREWPPWITDGTQTETWRSDPVRFGPVLSGSYSDDDVIARYYVLAVATIQETIAKVYTYTPVPGDPDRRNVDYRHSSANFWGGAVEVGFLAAGNPQAKTWDWKTGKKRPDFWKRFIPGGGFLAGVQYVDGQTPDTYVGFTPNIHIFGPSLRLNMEIYRTGEGFWPRFSLGLIIW